MIEALFFYVFSAVLLISAALVISARNPVHAVLFLILAFFNAAGLFVMLGAEFIAMILVIVYVGAVAVLFLFVVMMLDIDFATLRKGMARHAPIGVIVGLVLVAELVWMALAWEAAPGASANAKAIAPQGVGNTHALGRILYTDFVLMFQMAGLTLLVAMVGAITLTLRQRPIRRQKIADQIARNPKDVLKIEKVTSGAGVSE